MYFIKLFNNIKLIFIPLYSVGSHFYLLREFISREIKGRFAGSTAGILWTLINPLVNISLYYFVFSIIIRVQVNTAETGTDSFFIYFLSGFFPWYFFSESLSRSVGILIENANLITKVVFPLELLPVGTVFTSLILNGIGMTIFLIYLILEGYFHISWGFLLLIIPFQIFFIWGLANFFSALCVFIRDMREIMSILLTVWFYATPVIYPASMLPASFEIIKFNPMWMFVQLYRDAIIVHHINWVDFGIVGIISLLSYCIGTWFFMRAKPSFGDVL